MKPFREISEAFDKPLEFDVDLWPELHTLMYWFKLSDKDYYRVIIGPTDDEDEEGHDHEVRFSHFKNYKKIHDSESLGKTNVLAALSTANTIKVFATVIATIKEHFESFPGLESFSFRSDPSERSRVKLYNKLAIMAARKLNWHAYTYSKDGYVMFVITKHRDNDSDKTPLK